MGKPSPYEVIWRFHRAGGKAVNNAPAIVKRAAIFDELESIGFRNDHVTLDSAPSVEHLFAACPQSAEMELLLSKISS